MADLTSPAEDVYNSILTINSGGVTGSAKTVTDGDNNSTALEVSTAVVRSTGDLEADGDASITGTVTANSFSGSGAGLTNFLRATNEISEADVSSTAYDVLSTDTLIVTTGTNNINLPALSGFDNRLLFIKEINGDSLTIVPNGSDTIDGGASLSLNALRGFILLADNTSGRWHVLANY